MQVNQHQGDDDQFSPGWEGFSPEGKKERATPKIEEKTLKDEQMIKGLKIKLHLSELIDQ
jgi:hypothetical protein